MLLDPHFRILSMIKKMINTLYKLEDTFFRENFTLHQILFINILLLRKVHIDQGMSLGYFKSRWC